MYGRQWKPYPESGSDSRNCVSGSGCFNPYGKGLNEVEGYHSENHQPGKYRSENRPAGNQTSREMRQSNEGPGKQATRKAMSLLERMDRTEKQLRDKLKEAEYSPEAIEEAIAYVKSFHYLDDSRYAEYFVMHHQDKMSRRQLKQKMMEKGVPSDIAEAALEAGYSADEDTQIMELLQKRHYDPETADEKEFRRTCSFLMRRGFPTGAILKAMKASERA